MPQRLTSTKYSAPSPRSGSLPRERLLAELDSGQAARLTLVSAPAGFGKSTLLTHWIERVAPSRSVAWLSLDDRDNDPALFWAYLGAALDRALGVAPDGGEPAREGSALAVAERLAGAAAPVAIVLDDYHLIDSATIQDQVAELIRDAPKGVQIVISTRVDPRLPLARLRAQGELVEVRASDLRFAPDEVEYYLTNSMDLPLQPAQVATLEARTEGWIAALQLAALSLRGRDDAAQFIAAFAGDDRFVVDYLAEEVLDRLEPELRAFLMDTCVLSRLSAPLCNAVAAGGDAAQTLDRLERGNLFVVPLDDRREWYRYHHLFGDMLRARLRSTEPGRASELHARASAWWEGEGDLPEAISHALAAGDVERAADLVQEWAPRASRDRQEVTLRKWIEALPPEAVSERPQLALTHIGVLMQSGEFDGVEALLDAAEPAVSATADSPDPALRHLRAMSAAYRAAFAQRGGDLTTAAEHARRAFELTDPGDHLARGAAAGLSGLISWTIGDLAVANDSWQESIASLERAGHVADVMGGSIALTDILSAQGRPGEALEVLAARLRTSALQPAVLRGTADMHVAIAWIRCRQGDLAAARESLDRAESLGESAGLGQNPYRSRAALAHVLWAEGELDDAAELLTEADRVYDGDFFPNVRPVPAMRARLDLARGRTRDALAWAANSGLTLDDEPLYLNEYAHLTLALTRLADASRTPERDAPSEVVVFVERLRDAAEARGGLGTLPDILVVLAKAHIARNAPAAAEATLREAVAVAEAQHTVGPFALAGPSLASLLKRLDDTPFVRDLRAALAAPGSARPDQSGSVATLSARELDVLRLLRSDLDGPQIARELFVSVNTLRTHTKSIFAKLGVSNRRAAVRVAEQRGLFAER